MEQSGASWRRMRGIVGGVEGLPVVDDVLELVLGPVVGVVGIVVGDVLGLVLGLVVGVEGLDDGSLTGAAVGTSVRGWNVVP